MSPTIKWHLITGEYPSQPGGVSDYSRVVARGLVAAGDEVHVYAPDSAEVDPCDDGVTIHRLRGGFGPRGLVQLGRLIGRDTDQRLLVQYVPHAFGFKAMNLPFCLWLYAYARRNGGVTVMFHEVQMGVESGAPLRHRLLDGVTGVMARLVARSAALIFVATPAWEALLRNYISCEQCVVWLPVPSNIPVTGSPAQIATTRRRYVPTGGPVIGHFSSYPAAIAIMLRPVIVRILLDDLTATVILAGANSDTFRNSLINKFPNLAPRMAATATLTAAELSMVIASCDVMIQPYSDGVSSRRGSMMAALNHARAIVTTKGSSTEPLWEQSGAVALVNVENPDAIAAGVAGLIGDEHLRRRYETAAIALYSSRFDLRHTIEALRTNVSG